MAGAYDIHQPGGHPSDIAPLLFLTNGSLFAHSATRLGPACVPIPLTKATHPTRALGTVPTYLGPFLANVVLLLISTLQTNKNHRLTQCTVKYLGTTQVA